MENGKRRYSLSPPFAACSHNLIPRKPPLLGGLGQSSTQEPLVAPFGSATDWLWQKMSMRVFFKQGSCEISNIYQCWRYFADSTDYRWILWRHGRAFGGKDQRTSKKMTTHSFRVNYQAAQLGNGRIKSRIGKGSIEHRELETREDPITAIASESTSAKSRCLAEI